MAYENVTVLFTDLVGSTELSTRLSPGAADDLRRRHFDCLRREITAHGGTEVKNLGDGLMVVFTTASGALACAVAMQQAVERDNRSRGLSLGLRAGLSSGETTCEGDDYFGDPVVEAARLCARAEGGQILVSNLVLATAGRRITYRVSPLGGLELKGLPQPVDSSEVLWDALEDSGSGPEIPLPLRLGREPSVGLIGRTSESAALERALKRVAAGEGREVVLVSGEAGLGKTTLAANAARAAHAVGSAVLLGRCQEDLGLPYGPFIEALSHYLSYAPSELLESHVRSHGAVLSRIVPALSERLGNLPPPQGTDPEAERYLLFGSVEGLLVKASALQPVVLVLDDLQWADRPTLQLLRHIVRQAEGLRLLVVITYREAELSAAHPMTEALAALHRESGITRIALRGLDDSGVLAFLQAAAGHDLDDAGVGLAHAVYRETDGNPFFVGEVLRHLAEVGAISQDPAGRWRTTAGVDAVPLPESVRQVVGARVAGLGEAALQDLSLAAVIGREFDLDLLHRVSGHPEEDLLEVLDAAAARALVRELPDAPGRYAFSHALIQHSLYQDMGATRRARAHRAVAEALEAICGDRPGERVAELAHHWFSAVQTADARKAIEYSKCAGEAALAAMAPEDAVRYFTQALQLSSQLDDPDAILDIDLRIGLGNAQRQAGIPAFRETLLSAAEAARREGAHDRLVAAALANNRGVHSALGTVDAERVAVLEASLDAMAEEDSPERALILATLAAEFSWGPIERRLTLVDEAKSMARRIGDPAILVKVLNLTRLTGDVPYRLAQRIDDAEEAYALAARLEDPHSLFWAAVYRIGGARQSANHEASLRSLQTIESVTERLKQPMLLWYARVVGATDALAAGDPERAESLATEAFRIASESGQPDATSYFGAQMLLVRFQQGRLAELVPLLSQVAADNPGIPAYSGALALALVDAGQEAEALELLEAAAAGGFSSLPMDAAWLTGMVLYCDVATKLGHTASAATLVEQLAPYHDQVPFNAMVRYEPVAFSLGELMTVLGRYDEAERYLQEAMEIGERGHMKFSQTRTLVATARMLAGRARPGDLARALQLLERARDTASNLGYGGLFRETTQLLTSYSG